MSVAVGIADGDDGATPRGVLEEDGDGMARELVEPAADNVGDNGTGVLDVESPPGLGGTFADEPGGNRKCGPLVAGDDGLRPPFGDIAANVPLDAFTDVPVTPLVAGIVIL